jgi:hypothetical protein
MQNNNSDSDALHVSVKTINQIKLTVNKTKQEYGVMQHKNKLYDYNSIGRIVLYTQVM